MGRQGARVDREAYFNAAFKILAEKGFHDLNVGSLCAELGVTRGSFYHHFAGMPAFVDGLLAAWEHTFNELLAGWSQMETLDVVESVYAAMGQWPVRAESALRAWAWSNPAVAASVRRHDRVWAAASQYWLARILDDPERCQILVHLCQSVIVGMMALQRPIDRDLVMSVCTELWRSVVGVEFTPDPVSGRQVPALQAVPPQPGPAPSFAAPGLAGGVVSPPPQARPAARLGREAYFNAAFQILANSGFQDLTVESLCTRLGVTRGSFYHHFTGMPDFVDGLLQVWEATVGDLLASWAAMLPWEAVVHVVGVMNRYPFRAEAALRAWGWSNPAVAASVRRWDNARENASWAWLENVIPDPEHRRVILHMSQALFVGMMMLQRPFDLNLYMTVTAEFARCTIGVDIVLDENGTFVPRFGS